MFKKVKLADQAPSVFVGLKEYPKLTIGLLTTQKDDLHDNPKEWSKNRFAIPDVTKRRRTLLHSAQEITSTQKNQLTSLVQEIAMAKSAVDCEIEVSPKNLELLENQQEAIPFGAKANLFTAQITSNISVKKQIERAVSDTDATASTAIRELTKSQISEYEISKLLSVANLGVSNARKFVPTRWSITAVDDIISKQILEQLPQYDTHQNTVFYNEYLGNHFLILLFDNTYMFELIEIMPSGTVSSDCELTYGRTSYVKETAGGYYATRLPILEYLKEHKKQAGIVVIRIITEEYHTPLGVWVVRETVRGAMFPKQHNINSPPDANFESVQNQKSLATQIEFGDKKLVSEYARAFLRKKFHIDYKHVLKKSIVLQEILTQKSLSDFFSEVV
jgi:DNA repair protein NreA